MCCLFGMIDYEGRLSARRKQQLIKVLAKECEVRGTDAAGIAYNYNNHLHIYKRPVPAHRLRLKIPKEARVIMGHTRLTTQGSEQDNFNNHPFYGKAGEKSFALAHNGVLYNDYLLRHKHKLPPTKIQTDSYVAVQLLEQQRALNLQSLKYMVQQVEGSFCFTVLDEDDNLYLVKGDNPLCVYQYPQSKLLIYASTEEILQKALKKLNWQLEKPEQLELSCGEIVKIDCLGEMSREKFSFGQWGYRSWCSCRSYYLPYSWEGEVWDIRETAGKDDKREEDYLEELKSVGRAFGYTPEDIDYLLNEGFLPQELEEYFYSGII